MKTAREAQDALNVMVSNMMDANAILAENIQSAQESVPVDFAIRPVWVVTAESSPSNPYAFRWRCRRHNAWVSDCPCPSFLDWRELGDDPFSEHAPADPHPSLLTDWGQDTEGFLPEVPDEFPIVVPGMTEPDVVEVTRRVARFAGGRPLTPAVIETVPLPFGVTVEMAMDAVRYATTVLRARKEARAAEKAKQAQVQAKVSRVEAQLKSVGALRGARSQRLARWLKAKHEGDPTH